MATLSAACPRACPHFSRVPYPCGELSHAFRWTMSVAINALKDPCSLSLCMFGFAMTKQFRQLPSSQSCLELGLGLS